MTNSRLVYSDMFEDDEIGTLPKEARLLWVGLLVALADDQGRLLDNIPLIKNKSFVYDSDVSADDISEWLGMLEKIGCIHRYKSRKKELIQIIKWWEYQKPSWASPSKFESPNGWVDRVKIHVKGNKVHMDNWDNKGGFVDNEYTNVPTDVPTQEDSGYIKREGDVKGEGNVKGDVEDEVKDEGEGTQDNFSYNSLPKPAVYLDNGELAPLEDRMIEVFCDRAGLYGADRPYENDPSSKKWYADWIKDITQLVKLETSSAEMEEAIALLKDNGYACKRPGALIETIKNIRSDIAKFEQGKKNKLKRYKLQRVENVSTGRNEYNPVSWWETKKEAGDE